jgi:hypothetical protein
MPLTEKGHEIMANMKKQYGEEKGKEVFYASKNAGKISGVDDMNGGSEGIKTYTEPNVGKLSGDAEHCEPAPDKPVKDAEGHKHEFHGKTGPAIEDANFGLKHEKEEEEASKHKDYPKAADNEHGMALGGAFPHDLWPDHQHYGTGGFEHSVVMTPSAIKNSPLAHFKE